MAEDLVQLYIPLPGHWATEGELVWARPVAEELYEVDAIPAYAYGVHCGDVVRARDGRVVEVVEPRGHRTLRVFFSDDVDLAQQAFVLQEVTGRGASFERVTDRHVAIDVPPSAGYDELCDVLAQLNEQAVLDYETCEAGEPGAFGRGR
jgi:Domain of unknown function (DUF4265)